MSGRILILDGVATNRIVLKVKMAAAQYDVQSCSCNDEAQALIKEQKPDLLLINMTDPNEDRHAFCRNLRQTPATASIGIICVGVPDTARARFAAMECGANDILPRPISDTLMMARVRNILRHHNIGLEWQLRDGTRRALGFEESATPLLRPLNAFIVSPRVKFPEQLNKKIKSALGQNVPVIAPDSTLSAKSMSQSAELIIVDGTSTELNSTKLFQLVADLQLRPATREAAILTIVPKGRDDLAAMVLDLGADEVAFESICEGELEARLNTIKLKKAHRDQTNDTVRNGLKAAVTDPLTGLFNRRYAEMHLAQIALQSRETGQDFALMIIDIDHFKSINDTYGHAAGDDVLKSIAARLQKNLRPIDLLARIGGEEFLIVLPRSSKELARLAADRLRRLVNDEPFRIAKPQTSLRLSISVGVAVNQASDLDIKPNELIKCADAALYHAKASGRNMVSMSRAAA